MNHTRRIFFFAFLLSFITHFGLQAQDKMIAKKDAKKGAKALVVYNSSSAADNILFDKKDTSQSVTIPVIYLTQSGEQKYFSDQPSACAHRKQYCHIFFLFDCKHGKAKEDV